MDTIKNLMDKIADKEISTIFSIMRYKEPNRTLLKILLDDDTQFVAELPDDYASYLEKSKKVEILYHDLFLKSMVKGTISMREIMHDAKPASHELGETFEPNKNSLYGLEPPLGLDSGLIVFRCKAGKISLDVDSYLRDSDLHGAYELKITDEQSTDKKGRLSYVFRLEKVQ